METRTLTDNTLGKFSIVTYGCQMNSNDSEIMSGILRTLGYAETDNDNEADIIIVNTCVVRGGAEDRALGRLDNYGALKRRNRNLVVIVAGCMAQKDGEALLKSLPQVDIILGTRDLFDLANLLRRHRETGERIAAIGNIDKPVFLGAEGAVQRKSGLKGFVTIMYGCNNFCSYCIVPTTRGRETSRPVCDILTEVQQMAAQGYREVQLLGQNVNSYKFDETDFTALLEQVHEVQGIERIRFVTSHPKDLSDRLIETMARLPKACEALHLPAQAGNNRILQQMNRRYTHEHYCELVDKLRTAMPDIVLSTDIIVGYPDETHEEFLDTRKLQETAQWDSAFMFMYSPRPGTKAAELPDTVSEQDKKTRLQEIIDRQEAIGAERNHRWVGRTLEVLVESVSRKRDTQLMGRTRGDIGVVFDAPPDLIGKLVDVRITETHPHTLRGELDTTSAPR